MKTETELAAVTARNLSKGNNTKSQVCQEKIHLPLSNWVLEDLAKSGLNNETIREMAIWEPEGAAEVKKILGWWPFKNAVNECYAIPYLYGRNPGFVRVKLRYPMQVRESGDVAKYLSPKGYRRKHLYLLATDWEKRNSTKALYIVVEGEKKAAKLSQEVRKLDSEHQKHVVIGIAGVTMWEAQEWEDIQLGSKNCFVAFDADSILNTQVARQGLLLTLFLYGRGAKRVQALFWDLNLGKGVDDYLVAVEKSGISPQTALTELLENAKDAVEFFAYYLGFQDVINVCANAVIRWKTPLESLFESFAKILKIGKTALKKAVQNAIESYRKKDSRTPGKGNTGRGRESQKTFWSRKHKNARRLRLREWEASPNCLYFRPQKRADQDRVSTHLSFLPSCEDSQKRGGKRNIYLFAVSKWG